MSFKLGNRNHSVLNHKQHLGGKLDKVNVGDLGKSSQVHGTLFLPNLLVYEDMEKIEL